MMLPIKTIVFKVSIYNITIVTERPTSNNVRLSLHSYHYFIFITLWLILLVEGTIVLKESYRPATCH